MAGPRLALTLKSTGQRSNADPNPKLGLQLALKGKQLQLAASKLVHIYMVRAWHALALRSKGQILTLTAQRGSACRYNCTLL